MIQHQWQIWLFQFVNVRTSACIWGLLSLRWFKYYYYLTNKCMCLSKEFFYKYHIIHMGHRILVAVWNRYKYKNNAAEKNTSVLHSELTSATPRSEILSAPSVVSSRFPGLMSLWTIPWLCKYSRPSISWQKYLGWQGGWTVETRSNQSQNVFLATGKLNNSSCCSDKLISRWGQQWWPRTNQISSQLLWACSLESKLRLGKRLQGGWE